MLKSARKKEMGCRGLLGDIPVSKKNLSKLPLYGNFSIGLCMCINVPMNMVSFKNPQLF